MPPKNVVICIGMFLRRDLYGGEVHVDAGAIELLLLLARISFGHQNQAMAFCEQRKGVGDAGKQLDGLFCNRPRKTCNTPALLFRWRRLRKLRETVDERSLEARHPVAVCCDGCVFTFV